MAMNPDFWRGKKVLVTGHTGFKGGWLSLWLQKMGAQVTGLSLPAPTTPSLFEMARVGTGMNSVMADIRDLAAVRDVFAQCQPEIVFHLAAQPLVRYSYTAPVETYATNVMGSVHVLEAIRLTPGVRAVVNITSDKCYENREWPWGYRENDPMGGYDPYSNSKGCAELVSAAYRNSYFNPADYPRHGVALATVRAGNVIGGGDWAADRLIPDILRAIEAGVPVNIRSPHAIRPWQHVLEPLDGYLSLAEKLYSEGCTYAEGWNFGPADDDAKPVQWIVEHLTRAWGEGASWQLDPQPQPHEAHYLKLDCSKARLQLGWQPRWNLARALQSIIDWHKGYLAEESMRDLSVRQINDYLATANTEHTA
jgi:CDP-glucose 4,6-dehydratase